MSADDLATALVDAGGVSAPREQHARLRAVLVAELDRAAGELTLPRSGKTDALTVVFAIAEGGLSAVVPVAPELRADPGAAPERGWLLTAAAVGALVDVGGTPPTLLAGSFAGYLALQVSGRFSQDDAQLAALAFDDRHSTCIDRLRVRALAMPAGVLRDIGDLRPPIGDGHPLLVAARIASLGGRPADEVSMAEHEDAVLGLATVAGVSVPRPHDDPDPGRRIARRILQRLDGMGKWGGYHTNFAHLSRGFAGNDRALAEAVGEALLDCGLLREKQSVGQRHVYLNSRQAGAIRVAIDSGTMPEGLTLPAQP